MNRGSIVWDESLESAWDVRPRRGLVWTCGLVLPSVFIGLILGNTLWWGPGPVDRLDLATDAAWIVLIVSVAGILSAPRRRGAQGEPTQARGGVRLPLRRGREACVVVLCAGWALVTALSLVGPDPSRRLPAMLVASVVLIAYAVWRLTAERRILLHPRGLVVMRWFADETVRWAEVTGVEAHEDAGVALRVRLRRGDYFDIPSFRHRWTPSALGAVITYYADNPSARAELTDVRAMDKFRTDRRPDPDGDGDDDHRPVDRTHGPQH